MNRYQKIKDFDVDKMAEFVYGIIVQTEEDMIDKLSSLGVEVSLCSLSEDVRINLIRSDLLKEETDDT